MLRDDVSALCEIHVDFGFSGVAGAQRDGLRVRGDRGQEQKAAQTRFLAMVLFPFR